MFGYNNPADHPMHYLNAAQTTVWGALQTIAKTKQGQVWMHRDATTSTLIFEKLTDMADFNYLSPGEHQYVVSTRAQDPSWQKHIMKIDIQKDYSNMYSRFIVQAKTDPQTTYGYNHFNSEYVAVSKTEPQPIRCVVDSPTMEAEIGYRKEFIMKNARGVDNYDDALEVALALQEIYGKPNLTGTITVSGMFPVIDTAEFGVIFDRNAIIRVIDDANPLINMTQGTQNVFRVTGIDYNADAHTTKLTLTTQAESTALLTAMALVAEAQKQNALENSGRQLSAYVKDSVAQGVYVSDIRVALFDSLGEITSTGYSRVKPNLLNNTNYDSFQIIAAFSPGNGTITDDSYPIIECKVFHANGNSSTLTFEQPIYKWSLDTLNINIDILRS